MNEIGLDEAYEKWADDLVGYATALVGPDSAADVVADAFSALLHGPTYRWSAVHEPRGYLFRCVLNAARAAERSGSRRARRERRATPVRGETSTDRLLADRDVVEAVRALSVQQRAVIYHTYWEDLPPRAVAELLGTSEGSVKRHLARARASLRRSLS